MNRAVAGTRGALVGWKAGDPERAAVTDMDRLPRRGAGRPHCGSESGAVGVSM